MALSKFTQSTANVQGLTDLISDQATLVKQTMDKGATDIKEFINDTLTVELEGGALNTLYYTKGELNPFLAGGGTKQKEEVFTIVTSDNGDGTFTYSKGGSNVTGTLSGTGGQIFALTQGEYLLGDNRVEAIVNDTLRRSVASGGLVEVDTTHVELTSPEGVGAEVTIKYLVALNLASNAGLVTVINGEPSSPYANQIIIDTSL